MSVKVELENGAKGVAAVPSGTSSGRNEAAELRDGGSRLGGKGVKKAVANVENVIAKKLKGQQIANLQKIDKMMVDMDDSVNKAKLGANAILGVSLACARVGAHASKLKLYEYLRKVYKLKYSTYRVPQPMFNILNGGAHAGQGVDIQEFMVVPKTPTFRGAVEIAASIFMELKNLLQMRQLSTSVGLEGGFTPALAKSNQVLDLLMEAAKKAGVQKSEYGIALDIAASELYKESQDKKYIFKRENSVFSREQLIGWYQELTSNYPIVSIEDGLEEDDWDGWTKLNHRLGEKINIVGDDLTVTNPSRLKKAIQNKCLNALIIKPNQIGTLTETMATIVLAQQNKVKLVVSHRSGDTPDPFIADLAVAVNAEYIKSGSVSRGERIAKYNRLLEIEHHLSRTNGKK